MMPSLYRIAAADAVNLFIMPKPSGDWLDDDLVKLRLSGVDSVVSMLMPDEAKNLGLADEAEACACAGVGFRHFPVPDRGLPDFQETRKFVDIVKDDLNAGKGVAVHCRAGIGRSGLLVCCVLISKGIASKDSLELVSAARGVMVPDTAEQRQFILEFTP